MRLIVKKNVKIGLDTTEVEITESEISYLIWRDTASGTKHLTNDEKAKIIGKFFKALKQQL